MSSETEKATRKRPSLVAVALSVLAAVVLIVSLLGPTWVALVGKLDVDFAALKTETSLDSAPGVQHAYFSWLAVTLIAIVILGLFAGALVPAPAVARISGLVVTVLSLAGLVLTLVVVYQLDKQDPGGSFIDHFKWLRVGGYLHVVGWVLAIVAATRSKAAA